MTESQYQILLVLSLFLWVVFAWGQNKQWKAMIMIAKELDRQGRRLDSIDDEKGTTIDTLRKVIGEVKFIRDILCLGVERKKNDIT